MSRSRIPALPREQAEAHAEPAGVPEMMVQFNIFRVLLHHPPLARAVNDLLFTLLAKDSRLDARLRELMIMRIGWVTGSAYEWTQHWRVARALRVPDEDLLAVRDWRDSGRFDDADRAVLAAVDDALAHGGALSREAWSECARVLGDDPAVLLEVVGVLGCWTMISGLLRSLEVEVEDGSVAWAPDGVGPTPTPATAD